MSSTENRFIVHVVSIYSFVYVYFNFKDRKGKMYGEMVWILGLIKKDHYIFAIFFLNFYI